MSLKFFVKQNIYMAFRDKSGWCVEVVRSIKLILEIHSCARCLS